MNDFQPKGNKPAPQMQRPQAAGSGDKRIKGTMLAVDPNNKQAVIQALMQWVEQQRAAAGKSGAPAQAGEPTMKADETEDME